VVDKPRALFLMGPTGTGKTDVALEIADRIPSHIISVDSAMVYRQMDIGTAKPDATTLARYPHALVDICDPAQPYSVAAFLKDARRETLTALEAERLPIFVGGTMLYFKSLRDGLSNLPPVDADIRRTVEARATELGWPALHEELAQIDPQTAARLHPNHSARIQRALEVWMQTGVPLSHWYQQGSDGGLLDLVSPTQLAIIPAERAPLHQRLQIRLQQMLDAGFVDEVRKLFQRGDLHPDLPSMRSVGYRQAWDFLLGETDQQAMEQAILVATRKLAKRQTTWLRSWPDLHRIEPLTDTGKWKERGELARDCLKFW
jgi:tRNA dimethylallyltransferase